MKKQPFIVKRNANMIIAQKNTSINNIDYTVSIYNESVRAGWNVVADQVYARNEHEATLKFLVFNDAHGFMLVMCFINALFFLFASSIFINILLVFFSVIGYTYALLKIYKFKSSALQALIKQRNVLIKGPRINLKHLDVLKI